MAKPGTDRDGAMVEKPAAKKNKDKFSPITKTLKLDRGEMVGKELKPKTSMKRKLSFAVSPREEDRESDTDSDPGHSSEAWAERLMPACTYSDKEGPDKKKVKKEMGSKKSTPVNILFGYPLSERKQMALLMQMTARDNSPDSTPSHPSQTSAVQKKPASTSSSRQKDKVNKRNERGETPLHMAAIRGDVTHVRELINLGADVNIKDFAGWTPLHEACNLGYYDVAKVLIGAGAEVNTQGLDDDTPLHDASSSGHKDIVKLLLRHGGNSFQANKRGERPVDVADSPEVEKLLKGEAPQSEHDGSCSESEGPPSVNPSSIDDNMEFSDSEKDAKQPNCAKPSGSSVDEYEFKDEEEEEEDLSKALNHRHVLRKESLPQEKVEDKNHHVIKQDTLDLATTKSKKQQASHACYCSSESSSEDCAETLERSTSTTSTESHVQDTKSKKETSVELKGKVKKKYKNLIKNKENQVLKEEGKENGKLTFSSTTTNLETAEKSREEDSFKMSFSPKGDSSVHLFPLPSLKCKSNHSLTDKPPVSHKMENAKLCVSPGDSCQSDSIKHDDYEDSEYLTESSSYRGFKHKEKSKHHQRENYLDGEDGPYKECSMDTTEAQNKMDKEGKVIKKHKLKHRDKYKREYEVEKDKLRMKEVKKESHRNLEFDREFWKENFFKSDEHEDFFPVKTDVCENGSPQKTPETSPNKDERGTKEKHGNSKDRRQKEDREKDKLFKKEKEHLCKDAQEVKSEAEDGVHTISQISEESVSSACMKEGPEEQLVTEREANPEESPLERVFKETLERRQVGKEKECEKLDKKRSEKEKKVKLELFPEKPESQGYIERWKEKSTSSIYTNGDNRYRDGEKLKNILMSKKPEDNRKSKDKVDRKNERDKNEKDRFSLERDKVVSDKKEKTSEKSAEQSRAERGKDREKEYDRKRKEKSREINTSTSNLKLLLEDRRSRVSEGMRAYHDKVPSMKLRDDLQRTPEKDKRERDKDRERDKYREKLQVSKQIKQETDKGKAKSSPSPKDVRPKEKRLVNDDLMQTSFERMLSLKDQEIEQWHRKHLEKMKQKERERLKQRPGLDQTKLKCKDKPKNISMDSCLSKDFQHCKSSDVHETNIRERALKDCTSIRSLSLDAKSPSYTAKASIENSRSPWPESEKVGLISRSVSVVSMASSEDSCQRPLSEYDSDYTMEGSDSQPLFSQSLFSKSSAVHEKEIDSLLEATPHHKNNIDCKQFENVNRVILPVVSCNDHPKDSLAEVDCVPTQQKNTGQGMSLSSCGGHFTSNNDIVSVGSELLGNYEHLIKDSEESNQHAHVLESDTGTPLAEEQLKQQDLPLEKLPCMPGDIRLESKKPTLKCNNNEIKDCFSEDPSKIFLPYLTSQQNEKLPVDQLYTQQDVNANSTVEVLSGNAGLAKFTIEETFSSTKEQMVDNVMPGSSKSEGLKSTAKTESLFHVSACVTENAHSPQDSNTRCTEQCVGTNDAPNQGNGANPVSSSTTLLLEHKPDLRPDVFETLKNRLPDTDMAGRSGALSEENVQPKPEVNSEALEDMHNVPDECQQLHEGALEGERQDNKVDPHVDNCNSPSSSSSPLLADADMDSLAAQSKIRLSIEEDVHVHHPRKRKMPQALQSAQSVSLQQAKEKNQQSLAAIVDSLKLEEIQPYQTERANPYYEYLHIRKKIEEKRKVLCSVIPQAPQYYDEYVTYNGSYLLDGNPLSKLCIPTITPPPSLPEPLKDLFKQQEIVRMKLRLQHSIEREKLILSNEQEVLRVHYRAARTLANQTLPFSACTVLLDAEVYNMPPEVQGEDGKTSVRDRFNARQFMSWLQDVDDKFDKLKTCLLMRQQHEAAALNAVQRLEWQLKLQELEPATYKSTSIFDIPEFYIPLVDVNDDFDLTPI